MIQIKTLTHFLGNPQNNDQILTLLTVLHDRHNNFYAPVTPSFKNQTQRKQIVNKETDKTAVML